MSTAAVQNPPATNESKSQRRKKGKAAEGANDSSNATAVPQAAGKEDSSLDAKDGEGIHEHPYIKELAKQIRNTQKKLSGMQKTDAVIAENPNTSLDDLVAQRKINNDQKTAALKKPGLVQQLATLEEQIGQYRKFDADYQAQLLKQKEELTAQHQKELEEAQEGSKEDSRTAGEAELRKKLLIFSQFLRAAAAKRTVEEEADSEESRAFEGALLLVYGGDEKAVETAVKLIDGADEQVPSIDGVLLPIRYTEIHQAAIEHAPFQTEESWVDSVAEANATVGDAQQTETEPASDPTIAHAGLTELDTAVKTNGTSAAPDSITSPPQGAAGDEAGNAAGDRWDTTAAGNEKSGMEDSFEMVPRPDDEVDIPANPAAPAGDVQEKSTSWADEPPAYEMAASSNQAGEGWDVKAPGDQADSAGDSAPEPPQPLTTDGWADSAAGGANEEGDGFHPVPGRQRGRGGRGRGGEGEFRGRGRGRGRGGFRGDGEFRGRGRGGFRGNRGEGGEFRGRGGRGGGERNAADTGPIRAS
ncbi:hypothetical protein LTR37_012674 [Vermiconidia calcicola]|uniref:Uncharacterized protein n=1 Tax=Vermiconidia calcicola TaxID=1690605 RepID=A0ACC3N007_9PEZI|nr:hypothetical protein LTR37_012674 [Vermiconidia calcicola]